MKKIFYILLLLTGIANAQVVNIPDANLKQWLLDASTTNGTAMNAANVSVIIDINDDNQIQESEAAAIWRLSIVGMAITNLTGLEAFTNLRELTITETGVTTVNLTQNSTLQGVMVSDCPNLNLINASNLNNLNTFRAMFDNSLQTVNLSGSSNIMTITITETELQNIDLSTLQNVSYLNLDTNNLQEIDISNNPLVEQFFCANNNLISLNMKNGSAVSQFACDSNPNLLFICADEEELPIVEAALIDPEMEAAFVSPYCSFEPGGNYNTITGTVRFDSNNNGCDANDAIQPNIRVNLDNGNLIAASFTSAEGVYSFYTQTGNFEIAPSIENANWFTFLPALAPVEFENNENNTVVEDFCLRPLGVHHDVEVAIAPLGDARPGFDAVYKVVYRNKGNQTAFGSLMFEYDDEVLDFVESSIVPSQQSFGMLQYGYANLMPFESRSVTITLNANNPGENPPLNIGDELLYAAVLDTEFTDEIPSDNVFEFSQTLVDSFDPNQISCVEGEILPTSQIGNYLHYIIDFENTGNAAAQNIVVRAEVDPNQFDIGSLQLMNSSAPVRTRLEGNLVEFIFQNVNLHSGGHGNILLKMKTRSNLGQGSVVRQNADIYFDYNFPITTNDEDTVFQNLSNPDVSIDASISVYPNPTKGKVDIKCHNTIKSVELYDIQGRILQTNLINENHTNIDVSGKSSGVYFVKIISDKGMKVEKIVKE